MVARSKIQPEFVETGVGIGDLFLLEDVGGNPSLPAVDGSKLTGVVVTQTSEIKDLVSMKTGGCPELVFTQCGAVIFLRNECSS